MNLPATVNETSFAVAYADASALVLDALTMVDGARADKLARAVDRLRQATSYAHNGAEAVMASSLTNVVVGIERRDAGVVVDSYEQKWR